jgi:hypothetical protein
MMMPGYTMTASWMTIWMILHSTGFSEEGPVLTGFISLPRLLTLQDSLLMLAAMDETERTAIVKQVSKKLRKERGLKDDPTLSGGSDNNSQMTNPAASNNPPLAATLFSQGDGNWYFSDATARGNGFIKFRQRGEQGLMLTTGDGSAPSH